MGSIFKTAFCFPIILNGIPQESAFTLWIKEGGLPYTTFYVVRWDVRITEKPWFYLHVDTPKGHSRRCMCSQLFLQEVMLCHSRLAGFPWDHRHLFQNNDLQMAQLLKPVRYASGRYQTTNLDLLGSCKIKSAAIPIFNRYTLLHTSLTQMVHRQEWWVTWSLSLQTGLRMETEQPWLSHFMSHTITAYT